MALIDPIDTREAADKAAEQLIAAANRMFMGLAMQYRAAFALLWNNRAATPEEIVVALGTDAAELFALSGQTAGLLASALGLDFDKIASMKLPMSIPEGWSYKANDDGTVTVTKV